MQKRTDFTSVLSCCNLNEEGIGVQCRVGLYWNKLNTTRAPAPAALDVFAKDLRLKENMTNKSAVTLVVNDINTLTIPEAYHQGENLAKLEFILDLAKERIGKGTYVMTERLLSAVVCMATRLMCSSQTQPTANHKTYAKSCTSFQRYAIQATSMKEYRKCYNIPTFADNTYQTVMYVAKKHLRFSFLVANANAVLDSFHLSKDSHLQEFHKLITLNGCSDNILELYKTYKHSNASPHLYTPVDLEIINDALISHNSKIGNLVIFGHVKSTLFGDMNVLYRISKAPEEVATHKFVIVCIDDTVKFLSIMDLFANVSNPGVLMDRNMFVGHFFRRSTNLNAKIGFVFRGLSISLPSMPVELSDAEAHWIGKKRDTQVVNVDSQFVVDNLANLANLSPATIVDIVSESASEMDNSCHRYLCESPPPPPPLAVDALDNDNAVVDNDHENQLSSEPFQI